MNYIDETLQRIASALERQVEQHDEAVARNLAMRVENIERHERERDAELWEARAANQRLTEQLDEMLRVAQLRTVVEPIVEPK